jgi:ATP-dependent RNA helicase UAP56/SUB2
MGKTAVFVLSILNQLPAEPKPCSALVLCHTRELAYQIKNEFARFTKHLAQCKTEVIYGGKPIKDHIKMFKDAPPTIVVGTPGRILDLVKRKSMKLEDLKTFVIDECDKVLESLGKFCSQGGRRIPHFPPSFLSRSLLIF